MEREGGGTRKGGGDCVHLCVLCVRTRVHACTHTCSHYTRARHTHIYAHKYMREGSSMCRMSMRRRSGREGEGRKSRTAEGGRKARGWTISREVTRECRAVERVCGLCASCE